MQLGEVVFGGVGSGLYGMLVFAIIAVFVAGLMVGRTPEYLGKKIEAYEMKMSSLVILIPPTLVLVGTAIAVVSQGGLATILTRAGRMALAKSSMPFHRRATTTAAHLPGWVQIRSSTTPHWASPCGLPVIGWPSPPWRSLGRWRARSWCPPVRARCPHIRRSLW